MIGIRVITHEMRSLLATLFPLASEVLVDHATKKRMTVGHHRLINFMISSTQTSQARQNMVTACDDEFVDSIVLAIRIGTYCDVLQ